MFDIGWTEMIAIAIVAILVMGPRELPRALRTAGKFIAKARSMARDFQSGFDDLVREAELEEVKSKIDKSMDPSGTLDGLFDDEKPPRIGNSEKPAAASTKDGQNASNGNGGSDRSSDEEKPELIEAAEVIAEPDEPSQRDKSGTGHASERAGS